MRSGEVTITWGLRLGSQVVGRIYNRYALGRSVSLTLLTFLSAEFRFLQAPSLWVGVPKIPCTGPVHVVLFCSTFMYNMLAQGQMVAAQRFRGFGV